MYLLISIHCDLNLFFFFLQPGKDLAIEVSTGLFDISSPLFKTTLLYCSYALATAMVAGVIWETWHRFKDSSRVKSEGNSFFLI